jgi:hypothetical protein
LASGGVRVCDVSVFSSKMTKELTQRRKSNCTAYDHAAEPGAFSLAKISGGSLADGNVIEDVQKTMARKVLSVRCSVK